MADLALDGDVINLDGLVNVDTVKGFFDSGLKAIENHGDPDQVLKIDLARAEIVGSAAVALLIAYQRRALELNTTLQIINAPEHFLAMASVSGVREILPFSD